MATSNNTSSYFKPGKEFWDGIILSFSLSVVAGLVIGGLIWTLLAYLSQRRRASAHISPRGTARHPRGPAHNAALNRPGFYRNNSYDRRSNLSLVSAATLTFQRQASMEQADAFTRKPSFRASTFHPLLQCGPLLGETGGSPVMLPCTNTTSTINSNSLAHPELHWSNSNLRGCHSSQTPPPAYETVIKAFQETYT